MGCHLNEDVNYLLAGKSLMKKRKSKDKKKWPDFN